MKEYQPSGLVQAVEIDPGGAGENPVVSGQFRRENEALAISPSSGVTKRFGHALAVVKAGTSDNPNPDIHFDLADPAHAGGRVLGNCCDFHHGCRSRRRGRRGHEGHAFRPRCCDDRNARWIRRGMKGKGSAR